MRAFCALFQSLAFSDRIPAAFWTLQVDGPAPHDTAEAIVTMQQMKPGQQGQEFGHPIGQGRAGAVRRRCERVLHRGPSRPLFWGFNL